MSVLVGRNEVTEMMLRCIQRSLQARICLFFPILERLNCPIGLLRGCLYPPSLASEASLSFSKPKIPSCNRRFSSSPCGSLEQLCVPPRLVSSGLFPETHLYWCCLLLQLARSFRSCSFWKVRLFWHGPEVGRLSSGCPLSLRRHFKHPPRLDPWRRRGSHEKFSFSSLLLSQSPYARVLRQ